VRGRRKGKSSNGICTSYWQLWKFRGVVTVVVDVSVVRLMVFIKKKVDMDGF